MFSTDQKLAAVEREVRFRRRVYARKVANGQMTREKAEHEIAIMEAIAGDYRERATSESPDLFGVRP